MAINQNPHTAAIEKERLDDLCTWLIEHLHEPLGWQTLTERSGLSHLDLQRLFLQYHQNTPMQWIRQQREAKPRPQPMMTPTPPASLRKPRG